MTHSSPDPSLAIGQDQMHDIRDRVEADYDDVIAVLVLRGSPERGLYLGVSSHLSVPETVTMLLAGLEEDVEAMLAATEGQAEG